MNKSIFICSDISKTFTQGKNKVEVLKSINFSLDKSSKVAIMGPSGSGKTTFLNILTGLDTPSRGKVLYNDRDLNKVDEIITISTDDAEKRTKKLALENGLLVGISSGANILAAERWIKKNEPSGIVFTILCDRGERYCSILDS